MESEIPIIQSKKTSKVKKKKQQIKGGKKQTNQEFSEELSHGILSYFGEVQNSFIITENTSLLR